MSGHNVALDICDTPRFIIQEGFFVIHLRYFMSQWKGKVFPSCRIKREFTN